MSFRELLDLFVVFGAMVTIACGVIALTQSAIASLRPKPKPPAKWQVTMSDPDGIPMRSDSVSPDGIARLISNINSGFYK